MRSSLIAPLFAAACFENLSMLTSYSARLGPLLTISSGPATHEAEPLSNDQAIRLSGHWLAVLRFEAIHERDQRVNGFLRDGVVDAGANAAD